MALEVGLEVGSFLGVGRQHRTDDPEALKCAIAGSQRGALADLQRGASGNQLQANQEAGSGFGR